MRFELNQLVRHTTSGEDGLIRGRAEYSDGYGQTAYWVLYKTAQGGVGRDWWNEGEIEADLPMSERSRDVYAVVDEELQRVLSQPKGHKGWAQLVHAEAPVLTRDELGWCLAKLREEFSSFDIADAIRAGMIKNGWKEGRWTDPTGCRITGFRRPGTEEPGKGRGTEDA